MAIETCTGCKQTFAVGLFRCPRCKTLAPQYATAAELIKKGTRTMPRITVGAGPTNADAVQGEVGFIKREERKAAKAVAAAEADAREVVDWASKTLAHLRKAAEERGLDTAGPKVDLAARIAEHEAAQATAEPQPQEASK